jgi:hypothetical protein
VSLAEVPQELAGCTILNVLVRGFYEAHRDEGCLRREFMAYRANYFDPSNSGAFVADVIAEALPGVRVEAIERFFGLGLDDGELEPVRAAMYEFAKSSILSEYRTDDQNRKLAELDARLMLAVVEQREAVPAPAKGILGPTAYIVTDSRRYIRAAEKCGIGHCVSARPQSLTALLEMVAPSSLTDRQFVALFENPLLYQSAERCWGDIEMLVEAGVRIRGVSITRLRHDTEQRLHQAISDFRDADEDDVDDTRQKHDALLAETKRLGYRPTPLLASLIDEGEAKDAELTRMMAENAELREAVNSFGQRKARWLRRFDRQQGRK